MCQVDKKLKLCTCSKNIDRSKDHWALSRKHVMQDAFDCIMMGMYIAPPRDENRESLVEWLISEMKENCFDFNYQPFDEDKLMLHLNGYKIVLVYQQDSQRWVDKTEDPFATPVKRALQAEGYATIEHPSA